MMAAIATTEAAVTTREQLILDHMPQVRWIAGHIHERLPASFSQEDLISTGVLGLIAAIDNYDPTHNASLRTYAEYRIRGAILDSLRGLDGIPPHKRKKAKQLQRAIFTAEQKMQRNPSEEEIAEELGVTVPAYHDWLLEVRGISLGSLDSGNFGEDGKSLLQYFAGDDADSPAALLERSQLQALLAEAVESIPRTEKIVIDLYYRQELTLAEISQVIHLHTSRVSQIKMQAVLRLRAFLDARIKFPTPKPVKAF